jgi:deoxyadenosine/deoxycytidine kinase
MKVVIDGNIGSGKTTQLNLFQQKGFRVFKEPIEQWPLDIFYSDISRWALMFQLRVFQTLPVISWDSSKRRIEFYERCQWSALHVFWKYMLKEKQVTEWEDTVLRETVKNIKCDPDLYIYLKSDPRTCHLAIQHRGQSGDTNVQLQYLEDLDVLYTEMVENIPTTKVVIDVRGKAASEVFEEILKTVKSRANELYGFDY